MLGGKTRTERKQEWQAAIRDEAKRRLIALSESPRRDTLRGIALKLTGSTPSTRLELRATQTV